MRLVALAAVAGAACTYNTTNNYGSPDARPGGDGPHADARAGGGDPSSCGAGLPTSAPPTIRIQGVVWKYAAGMSGAAAGSTVDLIDIDAGSPRATTTTDAQGNFSLSASTGGAPIDGYVRVRTPGLLDSYEYPAVPFAADTSATVVIGDATFVDEVAALGSVPQDRSDAFLAVRVVGCAGQLLDGATVTVDPRGSSVVSYPTSSGTGTFGSSTSGGIAYVNNVDPGAVEIDGSFGTSPLRGHVVDARVGALTLVDLSP